MKIAIFKTKKNFRKGGFHTNPDICWEIIVYVAFVLVLISLVFSFFLFRKINKGFTVSDSEINKQTSLVSKERVDQALEIFSTRAQKSTQIINSPSPIVDPSL